MPVTFEHATLPNGLTIISETDPDAHTAAVGYFVKTGARDEKAEVMGVSHFLEHMMFKGTDRRTAEDVNREFDEIGANYNAFTSSEMTCFYAHVLPEFLPNATDLLGDMLRPALRDDDFNTEKGVILEEIAMYKDNPFWVLYEEVAARHYRDHGLGYRVLGFDETIKDLKRDQMHTYFNQRYSADNTVVALAGKVDFAESVKQITALCGKWAKTGATRNNTAPKVGADAFTLRDDRVTRAYLLMLAEGPGVGDDRRYAATMLARALGAADNSRLHWSLLETGLADEAQAAYSSHDGTGDYFVYASCSPERLDEVTNIIEKETASLLDNISAEDLERQRSKIATSATLEGERPSGRMQRIGSMWTYLSEHKTLEEEIEKINSVTLDDVRAVYDAFPFKPRTVGSMIPAE